MQEQVIIPSRFRGPAQSANGGYACGVVARLLGTDSDVTLRRPPPLDRSLDVVRSEGRVELQDAGDVVAEGVEASVELEVPPPVSFAEAEAAALPHGDPQSEFPECFVCGRDRAPGDGLRIFVGPVGGRPGVRAAPWIPRESAPELVWAALDCPGAYATDAVGRGQAVLGRLAGRIERVPNPGERCVVVAWPIGEDGRKLYAGTALFSAEGERLAYARATWIVPRAKGP